MPTYRQRHTIHEDGHGELSLTICLSDTFDGLFATTGVVSTNVLSIGTSSKDLEIANGVAAQDELKLTVDESAIATPDDEDAVAFFRDVQDPDSPRYIAVFLDTPDLPSAPDIADCEFIGRIDPELKGTDLRHYGDAWSVAINPLREWETSAATFMDVTLEDIELKDLIDGNEELNVTGIDETWEGSNVADRLAYFKSPGGDPHGVREARWEELVNLSALLRKLADNVEQTLLDKGVGTYSIVFDDTYFDFALSPARFRVDEAATGGYKSRVLPGSPGYPFDVLDGDQVIRGIGDSFTTNEESVFMHYRLVKPRNDREKRLALERCGTFTEFLYFVAESLGFFVRFYQTSPSVIHVQWISKTTLAGGTQVYVRDAVDGSINLSVTTSDKSEEKKYIGHSTTFTADGRDLYTKQGASFYQESWAYRNSQGKGIQPLFTTGVVLANLDFGLKEAGQTYGVGQYDRRGFLPHNVKFYKVHSIFGNIPEYGDDKGALGLTTMLYIMADQNGEYINGTSEQIYAPVARVHATIDGVQKDFLSLSEYLNEVRARDAGYFINQYELKIPYINGFSTNADGSSASWKSLQLGSRIVIEEQSVEREFIVVGIERDYTDVTTKLKLHRSSRVAYTTPSGLSTPEVGEGGDSELAGAGFAIAATTQTFYECAEEVVAGDALVITSVNADGLSVVRRATATSADSGHVFGIALQDGEAGDIITAQTAGRVSIGTYELVTGSPVYVRTTTLPDYNVSADLLTASTNDEDAVIKVGLADGPTSMTIDLTDQFTLPQETAWACGCE